MSEGDTKALKALGCFALLAMIPLATFLNAFILRDLWSWFIVPLGLPRISLWHAAGISLTVAFLTYQALPNDDEDKSFSEKLAKPFSLQIAKLVVWGVGWLIALGGGFA